jgi:hypothetical protein
MDGLYDHSYNNILGINIHELVLVEAKLVIDSMSLNKVLAKFHKFKLFIENLKYSVVTSEYDLFLQRFFNKFSHIKLVIGAFSWDESIVLNKTVIVNNKISQTNHEETKERGRGETKENTISEMFVPIYYPKDLIYV